MKSWKTPKIWPLSVVSRHSMWWGDTYLWNFTQNSYGWFGASEISRHVSRALLSNPPVWYCFNCLHSDCVKLLRFHPSYKRSVSEVHNCWMHHFHNFANLFCPFSRSLCTKTRELVEMRWPEEPLYLPVDCYGCLYDGSLVLFSDSHLQTSQMCGLLMTPGERLSTMSLMTFLPEQRVWNQDTDSLCHITRSWWVWDPLAYHWAGEDSKSSRMLTLSLVRTQMTSLTTRHRTSSPDAFHADMCRATVHGHLTKLCEVHSASCVECKLDQK